MKKIINTTLVSFLLVSSFTGVYAHNDDKNTTIKTSVSNMKQSKNMDMDMKSKMMSGKMDEMKNMGMMKNMMDSEMMATKKAIMEKIMNALDEDGKKELNQMRKDHMSDMQKFMKDFPGMEKSDKKMAAKKVLKKEHFSDLKELLKNNPELYTEVAAEMEALMKKMMEKMQKMSDMKQSKNMDMDMKSKMMSGKMDKMKNMGMMKKEIKMKKRLFSKRSQNKMDLLVNNLLRKFDTLDTDTRDKKISKLLLKIEKAKAKTIKIKKESTRNTINDLLDYLSEQILEKSKM